MVSGVALSAEKKAAEQGMEQGIMINGTINDNNQLVDKDGTGIQHFRQRARQRVTHTCW